MKGNDFNKCQFLYFSHGSHYHGHVGANDVVNPVCVQQICTFYEVQSWPAVPHLYQMKQRSSISLLGQPSFQSTKFGQVTDVTRRGQGDKLFVHDIQ